eukprot:CAMPEP_0113961564 /NCGR_PEP_ID=MMETSP0011_2-20120614/5385_1 /TAXON_ID=101924 /ORGANISM="Rhodosorus marinus" /LENGTH=147 /DNA_ID=CAMNT_0000973231 /DNA_START=94 /DNA_END=537 /DNA_ORIENTATION=+ /assembly_acc=CAM_ASM_000156
MGFVSGGVVVRGRNRNRCDDSICRHRSTRSVARLGFGDAELAKLDEIVERKDEVYEGPPPGMMKIEGKELADQKQALNALSEQWKKERLRKEFEQSKLFGWTDRAEDLNCRVAMFGLFTGYTTELITGQTIPQQVETLLRILGVLRQ